MSELIFLVVEGNDDLAVVEAVLPVDGWERDVRPISSYSPKRFREHLEFRLGRRQVNKPLSALGRAEVPSYRAAFCRGDTTLLLVALGGSLPQEPTQAWLDALRTIGSGDDGLDRPGWRVVFVIDADGKRAAVRAKLARGFGDKIGVSPAEEFAWAATPDGVLKLAWCAWPLEGGEGTLEHQVAPLLSQIPPEALAHAEAFYDEHAGARGHGVVGEARRMKATLNCVNQLSKPGAQLATLYSRALIHAGREAFAPLLDLLR